MIECLGARHRVVHRDPTFYCAHPHLAVAANGDWVVVFNRAPRRPFVLHPPEEPLFQNLVTRSSDQGESWSTPEVVPNYGWSGMECAGLTLLANGDLLLNQWQFTWHSLGAARRLANQASLTYPDRFLSGWMASPEHTTAAWRDMPPEQMAPWVRGPGRAVAHLSDDHGRSWARTVQIDTAPYRGGYGMRGGLVLGAGEVLLPLSDVPNYRAVFLVRSRDGGRTWRKPEPVAAASGHEFEEPSLLQSSSGQLVMLLRDNISRLLHQVVSDDLGHSWSRPERLSIAGYPPSLLDLGDARRLLCTFGWRQPDYGIGAVLSPDNGATWSTGAMIRIRGGLPNKNLGYPTTIRQADGSLVTIYYAEDADGVTSIQATYWRLPE